MLKAEIRELLDHGHELEWEWSSLSYSLLPVWDDPSDQYHVNPYKADFIIVDHERSWWRKSMILSMTSLMTAMTLR